MSDILDTILGAMPQPAEAPAAPAATPPPGPPPGDGQKRGITYHPAFEEEYGPRRA
jgi:hypothetical protein